MTPNKPICARYFPFAALIAIICLLLMPSARAQDAGESVTTEETQVGAWLLRCVTVGSADKNCALTIGVFNSLEQRELGALRIFLVAEKDRIADEVFAAQLSVPTHVKLQDGIQIQVDQRPVQTVDYEICSYRQCISTFALSDELGAALSTGFSGTVRLVDANGTEQRLDFALDGFARGLALLQNP